MKKTLSMLLAFSMLLGLLTTMAFAAKDTAHTITITNPANTYVYEAYQVFKGDLSTDNTILSNIEWGEGVDSATLLNALKADATLGSKFVKAETAADVAEVLSDKSFTAEHVEVFANLVATNLKTVADTSTVSESAVDGKYSYTISVKGDGYYFIKDKADSVGSTEAYTKYILRVVENIVVAAKSDVPTLDKSIVDGDKDVEVSNGSIGDTVNYKLKSNVPNMTEYDKYFFIIHDTLSNGLTLDAKSFNVQVGEQKLNECFTDCTHEHCYTLRVDGQSFELVFNNFKQYTQGSDVVVTYSATINANAVIGVEGNPNQAKLEYSNNPNVTPNGENEPAEGENVTGETPDDFVITYITGVEIIKVDDSGNRLAGAEFKITGEKLNKVKVVTEKFEEATDGTYYLLKNGSYTATEPEDSTKDQYADIDKKYTKTEIDVWNTTTEKVSAQAYVSADGILRFDGLAAGDYVIKEITAPDGYNLLTDTINITIVLSGPTGEIADGNEDASWTVTGADGAQIENGRVKLTVENKSGSVLPETGGIGTTMFYVLGGLMAVGAGVLLIAKKRMDA